jgi:hypothetical protein
MGRPRLRRGDKRSPGAAAALYKMLLGARAAVKRYSDASEYYGEELIDEPAEKALLTAVDKYLAELRPRLPKKKPKAAKRRGRPPVPDDIKQLKQKLIADLMQQSSLHRKLATHRARKHLKAKRLTG